MAKKKEGSTRKESRQVYAHSIVNRVTVTTRQGNQTGSTTTWTRRNRR